MTLDQNLIEILCCPKRLCRGDLGSEGAASLSCRECKSLYPIIDGIPVLFPNVEYSPTAHRRHWDQQVHATSYAGKYDGYLKKQGHPWGLYTHESELFAIKRLTTGIDLGGKTILDAGCGNGRLLTAYPEAGQKIGIDASLALLQAAKKREPSFWFVCGQLEDMPFKDAAADFSVSIRVFQHLRAPEQAFAEMVRITKPSGHVALENYNRYNLKELYKRIRMWEPLARRRPWGLSYDAYHSFRDIEQWSDACFVKPLAYRGAGWGFYFYLFELVNFRGRAPHWLQRPIYRVWFWFERQLGSWPVFRVTMEKICFIGSVQAPANKPSLPRRIKQKIVLRQAAKKLGLIQQVLEDRNYAFVGSDEAHLHQTIGWLTRAHDATPDGGVARGASLRPGGKANRFGWQPSYPETTGYIIPTMLRAAELLRDRDLASRARKMADWELAIMYPSGAVHGGNLTEPSAPAIFDTGQVIRGLVAIYQKTREDKYLVGARRAADWLAKEEAGRGLWIENNASSVDNTTTTYNVYAAAPVVTLGILTDTTSYREMGIRVGVHTLKQQNAKGWFVGSDFKQASDALLHTIAYTIDGLWDISVSFNRDDFKIGAQRALDGVLSAMRDNGFIPGRLDNTWGSSTKWACLTGIAQIGLSCGKVFRTTGERKYQTAARRTLDFLKARQNNMYPELGGGLGAVWGSWPINGPYGQYQALNWAGKYLADLLLEMLETKNHGNV